MNPDNMSQKEQEEFFDSLMQSLGHKRRTLQSYEAQENFEARLLSPNYELADAIEKECPCDP
jgi:hypothetical protein